MINLNAELCRWGCFSDADGRRTTGTSSKRLAESQGTLPMRRHSTPVTYPVVGWLGAKASPQVSFLVLAALAIAATLAGMRMWPASDPSELEHEHADMDPGHAHLASDRHAAGQRHSHVFVIDDEHRQWPADGSLWR